MSTILSTDWAAANTEAGPYWALNSTWNNGGLVNGTDYTQTITMDDPNSPNNNTTISWTWPNTPPWGMVYAYPGVFYGTYGNIIPNSNVTPERIDDLKTLTLSANLSFSGETDHYDAIYDMYLTSQPDGNTTTGTHEIEVWAHTPSYAQEWIQSLPQHTFTAADGMQWTIALSAGSNPPIVLFVPSDFRDLTNATIDFKALLKAAEADGLISGNEYFDGIGLGNEASQGSGSMTIHSFKVNYDGDPNFKGTTGGTPAGDPPASGNTGDHGTTTQTPPATDPTTPVSTDGGTTSDGGGTTTASGGDGTMPGNTGGDTTAGHGGGTTTTATDGGGATNGGGTTTATDGGGTTTPTDGSTQTASDGGGTQTASDGGGAQTASDGGGNTTTGGGAGHTANSGGAGAHHHHGHVGGTQTASDSGGTTAGGGTGHSTGAHDSHHHHSHGGGTTTATDGGSTTTTTDGGGTQAANNGGGTQANNGGTTTTTDGGGTQTANNGGTAADEGTAHGCGGGNAGHHDALQVGIHIHQDIIALLQAMQQNNTTTVNNAMTALSDDVHAASTAFAHNHVEHSTHHFEHMWG
jgi:hypothetical protein